MRAVAWSASKTNNVARGSRRSRLVRTRSLVPELQMRPSITAIETRTALAVPSAATVTIAADGLRAMKAMSSSESGTGLLFVG